MSGLGHPAVWWKERVWCDGKSNIAAFFVEATSSPSKGIESSAEINLGKRTLLPHPHRSGHLARGYGKGQTAVLAVLVNLCPSASIQKNDVGRLEGRVSGSRHSKNRKLLLLPEGMFWKKSSFFLAKVKPYGVKSHKSISSLTSFFVCAQDRSYYDSNRLLASYIESESTLT